MEKLITLSFLEVWKSGMVTSCSCVGRSECLFCAKLQNPPLFGYVMCMYIVRLYVCVCVRVGLLSYLPTPPLGQDMTQGQFLSGV